MSAPTMLRLVEPAEERLGALDLAAVLLVEGLVKAGYDLTADEQDLEVAYFALVPVLRKLGVVDVDPGVESASGLFLRAVRQAAVIRRRDRRTAQWRGADGRWECQHGWAPADEGPCTDCLPVAVAA